MRSSMPNRTIILASLLFVAAAALTARQRTDLVLSDGWKFARENPVNAQTPDFNDASWERVTVPHTWNTRDAQDGGNDYYRGTGWYRRQLTVDAKHRGKTLALKFDGAATATTVYVNGKEAGSHKGNYGAFCFDITRLVKIGGSNTIAVKVNNAKDSAVPPLRGDFSIFGGIYRSVHLLVLNPLSISPFDFASSGIYAKQVFVSKDSALVEVTALLNNAHAREQKTQVRVSLLNDKGKLLVDSRSNGRIGAGESQTVIHSMVLMRPHLWNGRKDPYLYRLRVEMLSEGKTVDVVEEPLGLRFYRVDPDSGFFLNGEPYRLHGVNRHQDRENMGSAITLKEHTEDFRLIEEIGANAIRLAHYQQAQEIYGLCDTGGMVVWAELALVDDVTHTPAFLASCRQQLTELIKQNYNHPSIMFWSLQNELIPDGFDAQFGVLMENLNGLAKSLDPTRLTTVASRSKYAGNDRMNAVSDVIAYNVYRGWYEGKPENFAKYADSLHARFPTRAFGISEYGAGGSIHQHEANPKRPNTKGPWHPEEWQSTVHEITWNLMEERPFIWGTFVWNMFDFGSDGRTEGDAFGRNDKGLVTYDRKVKKDAFFWYKANWNPEPMVHITSKRFSPQTPGKVSIKVYSNCDSVQVFLGKKSLGWLKGEARVFSWPDQEVNAGTVRVSAIGLKNGKKFEDRCEWLIAN